MNNEELNVLLDEVEVIQSKKPITTTMIGEKPNYSSFWAQAEVVPEPKSSTAEPVAEADTDQAQTTTTTTAANAPTKKEMKIAAETCVAAIDMGQKMIFAPLMSWRFKKIAEKKLGKEGYLRAMELSDGEDSPVDEREERLKKKFNKNLKQLENKLAEIPFSEDEEERLNFAFEKYFEVKQQAVAPEILLYIAIASTLGKRTVDVLVWD
jgi:hypothetical protein